MTAGDRPWWETGVIYQVYPRSFADSNGDGVGDLRGVTEHLEHLSTTLGIDAVWISPIFPSPNADFGYDISDYVDVDPLIGDLTAFDELISAAHAREMRIILDLVPNHTSAHHAWFQEARSSRQSPYRDWYVWADAGPDGSPPNNWRSVFGGSAWAWDEHTRQYYLHSFLREQPDLNWRNPALKAAMFDVMRFWLGRGVDGFRIDTAHFIMKDPALRDNPPATVPDTTGMYDPAYSAQLHVYDKGYHDIHDIFREIRAFLDTYDPDRPRLGLGEIYETDWPTWASYYGSDLDGLHMPYNFALILADWSATGVRAAVAATEAAVPAGAWPNYVLGNHDRRRVASRVGEDQARIAMMLLLTLRGTPTIYYGDEIGMHDVPIPVEARRDPLERIFPGQGRGRDPERTPMQWSGSPNAGFCSPVAHPWLPIASDYAHCNVDLQRTDDRSMLALTRALLRLRRSEPCLQLGAYAAVHGAPERVFAYERSLDGRRCLVALNFGDRAEQIPVPPGATVLLSTHLDGNELIDRDAGLRPNEGCVFAIE